jgi:hypothetical protein
VVNTNPISVSTGGAPGLYASRWQLPSENRLAAREKQLQGMLPSQQRSTSYLGTPAGGGYSSPATHYTDYLGSLNYRKPTATPALPTPALPRTALPKTAAPKSAAIVQPLGLSPLGSGPSAGTIRYGPTQPVSSIAKPLNGAQPISGSPGGAGSVRYGGR